MASIYQIQQKEVDKISLDIPYYYMHPPKSSPGNHAFTGRATTLAMPPADWVVLSSDESYTSDPSAAHVWYFVTLWEKLSLQLVNIYFTATTRLRLR